MANGETLLSSNYEKESVDGSGEDFDNVQSCFAKWVAPCENVSSGICGQRRDRSDCASSQSDQDLCCPLQNHWLLQNVLVESKGMIVRACAGWSECAFLQWFESISSLDEAQLIVALLTDRKTDTLTGKDNSLKIAFASILKKGFTK